MDLPKVSRHTSTHEDQTSKDQGRIKANNKLQTVIYRVSQKQEGQDDPGSLTWENINQILNVAMCITKIWPSVGAEDKSTTVVF